VGHGSSLAVATNYEDGVWTRGCGGCEEILFFLDACWVGAAGDGIGRESCCIINALDCNTASSKGILETLTGGRADNSSLWMY